MKQYDVIVIGAGDVGLGIAFKAVSAGLKVALINKGNLGGTCVNDGCVPSKMLLSVADRIVEIAEAKKLGIKADISSMDFDAIMERMRRVVGESKAGIRREIENSENLDFYSGEAHFLRGDALQIADTQLKGEKIFIASGARPIIPPIKGLSEVDYLTNETVLDIHALPQSLIIVGGGYIACEYGHFFASLGTKVSIVQRNKRLLPHEEPEIADLLRAEMAKRMKVYTDVEALEVQRTEAGCVLRIKSKDTGEIERVVSEKIMIATGRQSNADSLSVERAGIETDKTNFIKVDEYLKTSRDNIWALGDAIGTQMFTHAGDKEAMIAWHNASSKEKIRMEFNSVPHAVFTYPQIASVGLTEEEAKKRYEILVGKAMYSDVVKGEAIMEEQGFAKAIVEKNTQRILGFHIIGPDASILIQEVANTVSNKGDVDSITGSMHIFPAMSELIVATLENLKEPDA
ncbi:MAG: dihydrolipoyl dehydrogenase family protein [Dissulfurispiraceae bacterium]